MTVLVTLLCVVLILLPVYWGVRLLTRKTPKKILVETKEAPTPVPVAVCEPFKYDGKLQNRLDKYWADVERKRGRDVKG